MRATLPIGTPGDGRSSDSTRRRGPRRLARPAKRHFGDGIGSLRVRPEILGDQHASAEGPPFAVGDLDPLGSYVHVMDDITLSVVLGELDTVLDFAEYLTKKAAFVRSGRLGSAAGEHDLLAHYLTRLNEDGDHEFFEVGGTTRSGIRPGAWAIREIRERPALPGTNGGEQTVVFLGSTD